MLRSQQRFKSEIHIDVFTEEINKIALSSNYDKRLQTFDGCKCWKCNQDRIATLSKYKIVNFDFTIENKTEHNPNWPHIPDHPYRILIIGGSGSGKKCVMKSNKLSTRY